MNNNLTPMLKQYFEIKKSYQDSILFFRMGDFYEMFFDDAKKAAPLLEIVLTTRNKNKENSVPLCGIPYHAKNYYAAKLLRKGYKVAICDQIEDPATAVGIVKRDVTYVLTPGTALEIDSMESDIDNYIISIYRDDKSISIASIDLSVSDFELRYYDLKDEESFINELYQKHPKEIVCPESYKLELKNIFKRFPEIAHIMITTFKGYEYNYHECREILKNQLKISSIEGIGMTGYDSGVIASGVLLKYLQSVRKRTLNNLSAIKFIPLENHLILDAISLKNLEILTNLKTGTKRGSLFEAIDYTITPMGKRLLKKWLSYPLKDPGTINKRHDGVDEFFQNLITRSEVRKILVNFNDLAKLNSKISLNVSLPSHLLKLRYTLENIPFLKKEIHPLKSEIPLTVYKDLDPLIEVTKLIELSILETPSDNLIKGNYIQNGYNKELDELREITKNAKEIISAMEAKEKKKTGISSLKIKYNRVFGYFIEVTKTHLQLIPDYYIRKQTLVNSERFITDELKKLEEKILKAEEQILQIERDIYNSIIAEIQKFSNQLNKNSDLIALIDVISAGGELAQRNRYVRPDIKKGNTINIKDGRHPVVEINTEKGFIPNDTKLSSDSDQILIITGPNMGGKSTYLRQNALIVILAQTGYFVPARKASIGICDRIFTRIGASDSLIEGKSTFLVEMIETAIILNNSTARSLILLDEIGRGTSTYDGISIAWAVIEHLHYLKERPKTLFATHYHELTELSELLSRVKNYHITVREWEDNVVFLHKIAPGATDQSFGIHVAKIAGVPHNLVERAKDLLFNLEKKELSNLIKERIAGKTKKVIKKPGQPIVNIPEQTLWMEVKKKLKDIDISTMTPLEALNILHYLKSEIHKL